MKDFYIGNPDQLWAWDEPSENGNIHTVMSEKEILDEYFDGWAMVMRERGKENLVTESNCIRDVIVVNWAYKVETRDEN